jgi:hypothetical protein
MAAAAATAAYRITFLHSSKGCRLLVAFCFSPDVGRLLALFQCVFWALWEKPVGSWAQIDATCGFCWWRMHATNLSTYYIHASTRHGAHSYSQGRERNVITRTHMLACQCCVINLRGCLLFWSRCNFVDLQTAAFPRPPLTFAKTFCSLTVRHSVQSRAAQSVGHSIAALHPSSRLISLKGR